MRVSKNVLAALSGLAVVSALGFAASCTSTEEEAAPPPEDSGLFNETPEEELEDEI